MSTLTASLLAIGFSLILLTVLALRDPKRIRTSGLDMQASVPTPLSRGARGALGWSSLLPGLALTAAGQWPALLIWLGACCSLGWALTQLFAPASAHDIRDGISHQDPPHRPRLVADIKRGYNLSRTAPVRP